MFLFVFAGAKRRIGELSEFRFLIPIRGVAKFNLKIKQKKTVSAGDSGVFLLFFFVCFFIYFAVLSLAFELKQTLEVQPYLEMNS